MNMKRILLIGIILVLSATALTAAWEFKLEHLVMCRLLNKKFCSGDAITYHILNGRALEKLTHISAAFWGMILVVSYPLYMVAKTNKKVKILHGLLPVCSHCKKIRNSGDEWEQIEAYISRKSEAEFSHSICPECMKIHYGDYMNKKGA